MNSNEGLDHWKDTKVFLEGGCPFCRSLKFMRGPCGGMSENFKCAGCGATYNDMGPFGVDLLTPGTVPAPPLG